MPRVLWSGSISFGLVNIPVKMVGAVREKDIRFHMLHAKDGSRIRLKRTCGKDGKEVELEDIVKGYEVSKGHYVTFTEEELEKLQPASARTIEIKDFVKLDEIDPAYYDKPYFLVPDRGADKSYALLLGALSKAKKVGIARLVMHQKEHLVALRPQGSVLLMETMRFDDEVVPVESVASEVQVSVKDVDKRELAMASQLVEALSTEFDAAKYRPEHRDRLLDLIEKKAAGKKVVAEPEAAHAPRTHDLMSALQASLKHAKARIDSEESAAAEA